ncbi:hypothetical protein DJ68_18655 [Halorubrum sp. C3]|nr:hypothetical protein DJ68_18655 [Halorubrum sp. C3]
MADAFGRAIRDHHRGERTEPLVQGDGEETREHPIQDFYFGEFDPESDAGSWLASRLEGPLVDLGAGAGRHALWFQERFETVAVEPSPALVETMRERGAAFPGLDQLDFVVGALGLVFLVDTDWALATFTPSVLAVVLVMTPVLHVVTNVGAYALGVKNEPW